MAVTNKTYKELLDMIDGGKLVSGEQYRITDYVTTVTTGFYQESAYCLQQQMIRSAGHPFDIIVTATGENTLSPDATCALHSGDSYFSGQDLSQWKVKYLTEATYDGDFMLSDVAPWAIQGVDDGGRGAIYWMQDEYGNEAFYDFKNIQFCRFVMSTTIAESDTIPSAASQFVRKLRKVINQNPRRNASKLSIYIHPYMGYMTENAIYAAAPNDTWGGIYALTAQGTRTFAVIYGENGIPKAISAVNDIQMHYTFSVITSHSSTNGSDWTQTGNVSNCKIVRDMDGFANILPESIFLSASSASSMSGMTVGASWRLNTVKQGFAAIRSTQAVSHSLFIAGGTVNVNGQLDCVVVYNATGTRTLYANSYTVLFLLGGNYWRVPFISLQGTEYEVRVYGAQGTTPVTLRGAVEPFTTEEDKSEDMFMPLRTQSGYLKVVVDNDFDFSDLLPEDNMSRPVALIDKTIYEHVVWTGFLKAQNFNLPFLDYKVTLSLPVIDSLSNLESVMFEPDYSKPYINMAGILNYCVTILNIYEATPYEGVVLGNTKNIMQWLMGKVATTMFYEYDKEKEKLMPKYNCKEVLQNLMIFFGMTLRTNSTFILILPQDETPEYFTINMDDLANVAAGTPVSKPVYQPLSVEVFNREDNPYIGINNKLKLLQGCNEVAVTHERSEQNWSWEMPVEKIADNIYATTTPTRQVVSGKQLYTLAYRRSKGYSTSEWTFLPNDCKTRIWDVVDIEAIGYLEWNVGIELQKVASQYNTSPAFTLKTKNPVFLKDCVIEISVKGGVYKDGEIDPDIYAYQPLLIQVGSASYNGTEWQSGSIINTWPEIRDGAFLTNRKILDKGAKYSGYGAPINSNTLQKYIGADYLFDYLTIVFYRPTNEMTYTSISVRIIPDEKSGTDYGEPNKIKLTSPLAFSKEVSKSSIFTQDPDDAPLINKVVGMADAGTAVDTARALAQKIMNYGSAVRKLYTLQLRKESAALTPTTVVPGNGDGKTYWPVSISNKWHRGEQDVVLMEI